MNKLYLPVNIVDGSETVETISEIDKLGMQRVFTSGYEKVKDEDDVKELFSKVLSYRQTLKAYSMPDHKVENSVPDESVVDTVISIIEIGLHMIVLLPLTIAAFICYLFFLPVLVPVRLYAAKKARVDLSDFSVETEKYLVKTLLEDAKFALTENANAVGWYDEKVTKAVRILAKLYPKVATDIRHEFVFKWALAATSNGIKVDKNYEYAADVYQKFLKSEEELGEGKGRLPEKMLWIVM